MKISKKGFKVALYIMLVIPFLELLTFEQLIGQNSNGAFWNVVLNIFSFARLGITCIGVLLFSRKALCRNTILTVCLFVVAENLSSLINGSVYLNYVIGSLTIIGFTLICDIMMRHSFRCFFEAFWYYLAFLSLANFATVLVWPNGFFNAPIKDYAIYFLGSKNTAFFYYILFLYGTILKDILKYKRPRKRSALWIILIIISSYISSSASALVLFTLLLLSYLIWCFFDEIVKKLSLKFLPPLIIIAAALILLKPLRELFTPLFSLIGRDATFTGRDVLWDQALQAFKEHPLFGAGINELFILKTGVIANHAHSYYLDLLAKYGLVGFVAFFVMVIVGIGFIAKSDNKELRVLNKLIISFMLVHSILDHLMIYNFVLLLVVIEGTTRLTKYRTRYTFNESLLCM